MQKYIGSTWWFDEMTLIYYVESTGLSRQEAYAAQDASTKGRIVQGTHHPRDGTTETFRTDTRSRNFIRSSSQGICQQPLILTAKFSFSEDDWNTFVPPILYSLGVSY
jgi:hypothetical protein